MTYDIWYDKNGGFHYLRFNPDHAVGGKLYRRAPVVGTRGRRGGGGYFRHPGTHPELRQLSFDRHDEDIKYYKVKIRSRRRKIPTAWDDLFRGNKHSWKHHRRHQWKS